jgi:uncharacterized protein with NRDE domain
MDAGTGKALGFLVVLGAMGISSWLLTRKARRVMGKALGREIREGEETSLRAWMSMPADELKAAADEMQPGAADRVLETIESRSYREHKPDSDYPSIR